MAIIMAMIFLMEELIEINKGEIKKNYYDMLKNQLWRKIFQKLDLI